jgi:hypothetical protein
MMRRYPSFLFDFLLGIFVVSCVAFPAAPETVTPALSTHKPSATPLPSKTHTPTITSIPIPQGAGFVPPSVDVEFQTPLSELPSGEYLIFHTLENALPSDAKFNYASLDGQQSGVLFSLSPDVPSLYSTDPKVGFYWLGKGDSGLLFLDLQTQQVKQFDSGCEEYTSFALSPLPLDGKHFAFSCNEQTWHIVSFDHEDITSYVLPPLPYYDHYLFDWLTNDIVSVRNSDVLNPRICILKISQELLQCLEEPPYWLEFVDAPSPDGKWLIAEYADPQNPEQEIFALLPVDCLENPQENCEPTPLPNLVNDNSDTVWEYLDWSPNGDKIILTQMDLLSGCSETNLWTYDLASQSTKKIGRYPGWCLYSRGWTADEEHLLLINNNPSDDWAVWLVSTQTGELQRVAGNFKNIIEVVGLIQVP